MILGGTYFKLNIIPNFWGKPVIIRINQYDEEFTELGFEVYNGNEILDLTGVSASILGKKPDGTEFFYACTVDAATSRITVAVKEQMSVLSGDVKAELALVDANEGVTHTWNFLIRVEPAIATGEDVSETEILVFQELLDEAQESQAAIALMEQQVAENANAVLSALESVAPAYDSTATYAVGDYVIYDGGVYECNTAITTAEEWTAAHWTAVTITDEIKDAIANLATPYDATSTYPKGSYVLYGNALYRSNTLISTPETWNSSHWTQITVKDMISDVLAKSPYEFSIAYDDYSGTVYDGNGDEIIAAIGAGRIVVGYINFKSCDQPYVMVINDVEYLTLETKYIESFDLDKVVIRTITLQYASDTQEWNATKTDLSIPYIEKLDSTAASLASVYDNTASYTVGSYCIHDYALYRCTTAIPSHENWNASHWTQVTVTGEFATKTELNNAIASINATSIMFYAHASGVAVTPDTTYSEMISAIGDETDGLVAVLRVDLGHDDYADYTLSKVDDGEIFFSRIDGTVLTVISLKSTDVIYTKVTTEYATDTDLDSEASARQDADDAIQDSIDAEVRNRQTAISNEVNARQTADNALASQIAGIRNVVGTPLVAPTAADMTDVNKVYVYTGSEEGYIFGNWYYFYGGSWTSGGVYNATAINTDTTLSVPGAAADAAATGALIASLGIGFSDAAASALLNCLEHVAWIDDQGQTYYNDLYSALYANPVSMTATFTQGQNVIYASDSLEALRQYLTVTLTYADSTERTTNNYRLSGVLCSGTRTITVTHGNLSDTFTVVVSEAPFNGTFFGASSYDAKLLQYTDGVQYDTNTNTGDMAYGATSGDHSPFVHGLGTNTFTIYPLRVPDAATKIVVDLGSFAYQPLLLIWDETKAKKWWRISPNQWPSTRTTIDLSNYSSYDGPFYFAISCGGGSYSADKSNWYIAWG